MFAYRKGSTPVTKLTGFRKEWRHYWNKVVYNRLTKRNLKKGLTHRVGMISSTADNYGVLEDMLSILKYPNDGILYYSTKDK